MNGTFTPPPPHGGYDVVIRTQQEFEALLASPDWFGAVSVCFVGDGGALKFTRLSAIIIPSSVMQIAGIDKPIISCESLKYVQRPTDQQYWVSDLTVDTTAAVNSDIPFSNPFSNCINLQNCTGIGKTSGFSNCENLINCYAESNGVSVFIRCINLNNCTGSIHGDRTDTVRAFYECDKLANCSVTINTPGSNVGFYECTSLNTCSAFLSNGNSAIAFTYCDKLVNCHSYATALGICVGFSTCTRLSNCTGSAAAAVSSQGMGFGTCNQLVNCSGGGTGPNGYAFYDCSYLNGCTQLTASTTGFLGGTNTKVDTLTVIAS